MQVDIMNRLFAFLAIATAIIFANSPSIAAETKLDPVAKENCIEACNECMRACRECLVG